MNNLTACQRLCLRIIGFVTMAYLARHYSPQFIVDWAWDIETPDIFTLAGNNPLFYFTETIVFPRIVPLFVCFFSALWVWFMYDIEDFIHFLRTPVSNQKGFTLIEVMVVVAIIGIMSTISIMYINSAPYKLRGEASHIRGTLQAAKMETVKSRQNVTFGFNNDNKSIVDIWVGKTYRKTINLNYGVMIEDVNVPPGKISDKAIPSTVPQSIMDQCAPPIPLASCQALIDWGNQFIGKSYDHVIIFDPRGLAHSHGKFNIIFKDSKIPFNVNMVGNIQIGNAEKN